MIAEYADRYRFCPRCGQALAAPPERPLFTCAACGFALYFNPAVAAAAFILNAAGEILTIRRAREPGRGKLALPGGFIDADETAEDALRREVGEEVGLAIDRVEYLCSFPNRYPYRDVTYLVLDFYFVARPCGSAKVAAPGEVKSLAWIPPSAIQSDDLAFPSLRRAWHIFQTEWLPRQPSAGPLLPAS